MKTISQTKRAPRRRNFQTLLGRSVLLAEGEFDQAITAQHALQHAGAKVIGPFPDSLSALRALARYTPSCAVVDVRLSDGIRSNVAVALMDKGVPIILVADDDKASVPPELTGIPILGKPMAPAALVTLVARASEGRWY